MGPIKENAGSFVCLSSKTSATPRVPAPSNVRRSWNKGYLKITPSTFPPSPTLGS